MLHSQHELLMGGNLAFLDPHLTFWEFTAAVGRLALKLEEGRLAGRLGPFMRRVMRGWAGNSRLSLGQQKKAAETAQQVVRMQLLCLDTVMLSMAEQRAEAEAAIAGSGAP